MRTGKLQSGLQVLDCYRTLVEVNVLHGETQDLRYTAAEVGQQPDQQPVSQAFCCVFKLLYFVGFQIYLSHASPLCMAGH